MTTKITEEFERLALAKGEEDIRQAETFSQQIEMLTAMGTNLNQWRTYNMAELARRAAELKVHLKEQIDREVDALVNMATNNMADAEHATQTEIINVIRSIQGNRATYGA